MPTFNGQAKTITLDAPTGGVLNVDVQADLYSEWKRWLQADTANMKWNAAFRTSGGDDLTPGVKSGAYFFLRNDYGWRIISSDADQTINYSGNLVAEDNTLPLINATPTRTVLHLGLQPVTQKVDELLTQQQSALYNGTIAIDTINGTAGTSFPIGTRSSPVDNLADALTLAATYGFREFTLRGTITLTAAFENYTIAMLSSNSIVNLNGQSVSGTTFSGGRVSGTGSGDIDAHKSELDNLAGVTGEFAECHFLNTVTLTNGSYVFSYCFSQIAGTAKPVLDFNAANADVSIRAYSGGLDINNMSHVSSVMTVDAISAAPRVNSSCTSGTIVFRGVGNLTDNNGGTTVVNTGWVDGTDIALTRKLLQNRVVTDPSTGTITIYDDDNTPLLTANIYEDAGGLTPYSSSSLGIDRKDRAE